MSAAHPVPASLIASIVETYAPRRIILFGSAARGEARAGSDLDLLVELDDDAPREALHWRRAWEARRGYEGAVDIIPQRAGSLLRRADLPGTLAREVLRDGVVVYERA